MDAKSTKKNQLLFLLIGLTVVFLVVSYLQFNNLIRGPFLTSKNKLTPQVNLEKLLAQSQNNDTDGDGLTDFQEQYVLKTSPYLSDSDSDGFPDGAEVTAASNPLDSTSTPLNKKTSDTNLEKTFENLQQNQELGQTQMTPAEIRDLLVNKGKLSREIVDKIDDKTLIQLYNDTKTETGINPENLPANQANQTVQPTTVGSGLTSDQITALENLSPAEIRQLLLSSGMDASSLEKINDQDLKQIFLDTLGQQK